MRQTMSALLCALPGHGCPGFGEGGSTRIVKVNHPPPPNHCGTLSDSCCSPPCGPNCHPHHLRWTSGGNAKTTIKIDVFGELGLAKSPQQNQPRARASLPLVCQAVRFVFFAIFLLLCEAAWTQARLWLPLPVEESRSWALPPPEACRHPPVGQRSQPGPATDSVQTPLLAGAGASLLFTLAVMKQYSRQTWF